MVVGSGMLAKAFLKYANDNSVIIFASGVSNSKETNEEKFKREKDKLLSLEGNGLLVYFSTCSIFDASSENTAYVRHKISIECEIKKKFNQYIIFRLPIVVGHTNNLNTFFNYFKNKILSGDVIEIKKLASRHLIDIDDVVRIVSFIVDIKKTTCGQISEEINIGFNNEAMVFDIINMMLKITGRSNTIIETNEGSKYSYDKSIFLKYIKDADFVIQDDYNYNVLKKYL